MKSYFLRLLNFDANISLCFVGRNDYHKSKTHVSGFRIFGGRNAAPGELPFKVIHINYIVLCHYNIVVVFRSTAKLSGDGMVYLFLSQ